MGRQLFSPHNLWPGEGRYCRRTGVVYSGRRNRNEVLNTLLEKAGVQGYLTTDDLMEAAPDVDSERLSVILTALRRRGVDVLDPEGEYGGPVDETTPPEFDFESWANPTDAISSDDTVGLYLKEMARVPLLTREEELDIAIRIEAGRRATRDLLRETHLPLETRRELEQMVAEGQAAREHLIKANTRL
ncbi:MAG: hypothetical protein EHM81_07155, partial [Chloroflexi bacterium]